MSEGGASFLKEPALGAEEREALRQGVLQFNQGLYFECHDTLEEAWSGVRGEARDFFQGLIQISVALHHWRNGNPAGASSLFDRALRRLARYGDRYLGLDLGALRASVLDVRQRLAVGQLFPDDLATLPRFRYRDAARHPDAQDTPNRPD